MSTIENRLVKYQHNTDSNPRMKNQILIRENKCVLVIEGRKYECEKLEGLIKLSGDKYVEHISTQNVSICILPKRRLLVERNGEWYMGGFKKENSSECFLAVHAVTETDEIFIVWIAEEEIPICILIGDSELAEESIGTIMMKVFQYMAFNNVSEKLEVNVANEVLCNRGGGDVDEFE